MRFLTARQRDYLVWWWETFCSWFAWGHRMHGATHATPLPDGEKYSGPGRRLYQRCCRCGRFRIGGKFVEMFGGHSWWYECLDCALVTLTARWREEVGLRARDAVRAIEAINAQRNHDAG